MFSWTRRRQVAVPLRVALAGMTALAMMQPIGGELHGKSDKNEHPYFSKPDSRANRPVGPASSSITTALLSFESVFGRAETDSLYLSGIIGQNISWQSRGTWIVPSAGVLGMAGDFDVDGHADLIWQDPASGASMIWYLAGAQGTTITHAANLGGGTSYRIVGTADFNGDGHPDILWQDNATGRSIVWFMGGVQGTTVTGTAAVGGPTTWKIQAIADLNGDSHPDLIWEDPSSGSALVWFLGGVQGTTITTSAGLGGPTSYRIAAMPDLNGDGHPDLVWQDPSTGTTLASFLGGAQGTTVTSVAGLAGPTTYRIAAVPDLNADGHPDLIWQDPSSGWTLIWYLGGAQGTSVVGSAGLGGATTWRIVAPR